MSRYSWYRSISTFSKPHEYNTDDDDDPILDNNDMNDDDDRIHNNNGKNDGTYDEYDPFITSTT